MKEENIDKKLLGIGIFLGIIGMGIICYESGVLTAIGFFLLLWANNIENKIFKDKWTNRR